MTLKSFSNGVTELQKILGLPRQNWLLGAGASVDSGIPLMYPLTDRVRACLGGRSASVFDGIKAELRDEAHVEHVLSHIGDLIAIADRSKNNRAHIAGLDFDSEDLLQSHREIVACIASTVRYGYRPARDGIPEEIGTSEMPIVEVSPHQRFIQEVFRGRSNLEPRSSIGFTTTNYDTLLEDALAMDRRIAHDGFSGGAIGYWDGSNIDPSKQEQTRAHRVLKLHGSVDWMRDPNLGLLRARYGVKYLSDLANIMIYPQATKYLETQKDPFAGIFDCFRRSLHLSTSHLLAIVGYSFGDDHVNSEILAALEHPNSKLVIVGFSREVDFAGVSQPPLVLDAWLKDPIFGPRVYAATNKGLYNGAIKVEPDPISELMWWKFDGVTDFLKSGVAL